MQHGEVLTTLAEIAATLAALSAVVGAVGRSARDRDADRVRILLRDVASVGLSAALFSILPLILAEAAPGESMAWRGLSAAAVLYWILAFAMAVPRLARLAPTLRHPLVWAGPVATVLGLVLFGWNVVSPGELTARRYAGGILCLLVVVGTNFLLALFYRDSAEPTGGSGADTPS